MIFPCPRPNRKHEIAAVTGALATAGIALASVVIALLPTLAVAASDEISPATITARPLDAQGVPSTAVGAFGHELAVLTITVNGVAAEGLAYVARDPVHGLLLDQATLVRLKVRHNGAESFTLDGQVFVALRTLLGVTASIAVLEQRLDLGVDPTLLPTSTNKYGMAAPLMPQTPDWGGFLNYGLYAYGTLGGSFKSSASDLAGTVEGAIYGPAGSGGASFLVNPTAARRAGPGALILLDATWRRDDAQHLRSYVIGDALTAPGWWGRPVRFGGVQYSSNYTLQPGYVTYPLLSVAGIAAVSTAAEIYANNVRLGTQNVPAGPFSITNVPTLSGAGELQVVVNNALGQQQVITQPFYVSSQLLQPGLSEFSYSAGAERYNYGLRNLDYRGWLASGLYRYGVNDSLTVEGRAESDRDIRGAGLGVDYVVSYAGILHAGLAGSQSAGGEAGGRFMLGFERQSPQVGLALRSSWSTNSYREIGDSAIRQTRASSATVNFALPYKLGSMAVAYSAQRYVDTGPPDPSGINRSGPLNISSVSYSAPVGDLGFFSVSLTVATGIASYTQALATFTVPFGKGDTSVSLSGQRARAEGRTTTIGTFDLQHGLPVGEGLGYYARADTDRALTGGGSYNGPYGRYAVEASRVGGSEAVRGSIVGGMGFINNGVFFARPIDQSFALVKVDDIADVRVLLENIDVGRTGADGTLLLPRIPSYTPIKISIDPLTIPLDSSITETEKTLVAMHRTGMVMQFESRRERNALVRLIAADGAPVPAGAYAHLDDRAMAYPIANGGEVYISDLGDEQSVEVRYRGRRCRVAVELARGAPAVSDIGPLICDLQ